MAKSFETEGVESPPSALPALSLPERVAAHPLLDEATWIAHRDSGIAPLVQTELVTDHRSRAEFLTGAWLLNLLDSIHPQQLRVSDMLTAGKLTNGVIMPRRSSKTTTLLCVLLGRCYLRPVHYAGFTLLTTQKKTAERFRLDVLAPIQRQWPDPDTRPVKVLRGNGSERVEFPNGSVLTALSPDGEAMRSGSYDTLLLDEGGEASPERGEDIVGAVYPTFDTRPEGQVIVAGTAAKYRAGNILWDTLEDSSAGIIRYTVRDTVVEEDLDTWASAGALIAAMHPGVGTLTTLERIENNYNRLSLDQFGREYLGLFGIDGESSGVFNLNAWAVTGTHDPLPQLPERFSLAFTIHPDQLCASVVACWRDDDGRLVPLLLENRKGWDWVASTVYGLSRKHGVPITYDVGNQNAALVADELSRAKPRPRVQPVPFRDVKKAAALVVDAVDRGEVLHYSQQLDLESAVKLSVKRRAGMGNGWLLGRDQSSPNDDITAAEAWALAALAYDDSRPTREPRRAQVIS